MVGLFITIFGFVTVCYLGYTVLCACFSRKGITHDRKPVVPSVTLVICLYNEERIIEKKIENISRMDYPADRLDILFVNDHSSDRSREIIESLMPEIPFRSRVVDNDGPRGKPSALNRVLPGIETEITILTDADSFLEPQAIREIVQNFADPDVSGANGLIEVLPPGKTAVTHGYESLYRRFYNLWRKGESALDSITICNGPLMAFRSALLRGIHLSSMADDTEMLFHVLSKRKRMVYDASAVAFECTPTRFREQFSQKMRRSKGVVQVYWRNFFMLGRRRFGRLLFPFVFLQVCILPYLVLFGIVVYSAMVISDAFWLILLCFFMVPKLNKTIVFFLYTQVVMAVSPFHHRRAWKTMKSSRDALAHVEPDTLKR